MTKLIKKRVTEYTIDPKGDSYKMTSTTYWVPEELKDAGFRA